VEDEGRKVIDALRRRRDLVSVRRHSPELQHREGLTAEAYPVLLEQGRAGGFQLYEQAEKGDQGAEHGYSQEGGNAVEDL
jgi:hypothetical protein